MSTAALNLSSPPPFTEEGSPVLDRSSVDAHGLARLWLRRPSQRNSLTDRDLDVLLAILGDVNSDAHVRVLVVDAWTGDAKAPVFCSGYHTAGFDESVQGPARFEWVANALEAVRPLTLAAVRGSIYGGATDLALACDLRLGLSGCHWRMPANRLGLHYYPRGLQRYVSRLGVNLTKRCFLLGENIAFEDLQSANLFEALPDAGAFDAELSRLATTLLRMAPASTQATKASINEIARGDFDAERLRERESASLHSHDFREGRRALAEKRPARFEGR
jgi:enoyl-CoA hydratase/carnithine racemase